MIVSWDWDFGDGTTGTGPTPEHTYAMPGTYTVTLTVTDDEGHTATTSHDVTVEIVLPGRFDDFAAWASGSDPFG